MVRSAIKRTIHISVFHNTILATKKIATFRAERSLTNRYPLTFDTANIINLSGNDLAGIFSKIFYSIKNMAQAPIRFFSLIIRNRLRGLFLRVSDTEPDACFHYF